VVIGEYCDCISDQTARGSDGGGSIAARERLCKFFGGTLGLWGLVNSRRRVSFEPSGSSS
jgi:hypothetical protein